MQVRLIYLAAATTYLTETHWHRLRIYSTPCMLCAAVLVETTDGVVTGPNPRPKQLHGMVLTLVAQSLVQRAVAVATRILRYPFCSES